MARPPPAPRRTGGTISRLLLRYVAAAALAIVIAALVVQHARAGGWNVALLPAGALAALALLRSFRDRPPTGR